jgi:hypothetical protein
MPSPLPLHRTLKHLYYMYKYIEVASQPSCSCNLHECPAASALFPSFPGSRFGQSGLLVAVKVWKGLAEGLGKSQSWIRGKN